MTQPLAVAFVWNENNENASETVRYAAGMLARDASKPFSRAIDIPVFFYPGTAVLTPPPVELCSEQILICALIDPEMVVSADWRTCLLALPSLKNATVIPIALAPQALKIGSPLSDINFIRMYDYPSLQKEHVFIRIAHEIYRYGFNGLCRRLEPGADSSLKLFISHAKDGGTGLSCARQLKDFLDRSSFRQFFDVYDIMPGQPFDSEIERNIRQSTVILINSDVYSSRYWCQKEILLAKKYERPIIEADALDSYMDRKYPYAANIPVVRVGRTDGIGQEDMLRILAAALLETIRFYYADVWLNLTANHMGIPAVRLNRPPEPFDIDRLFPHKTDTPPHIRRILYPDPPLYADELQYLEERGIQAVTPLTCRQKNLRQLRAGISVSNIPKEESRLLGQDSSHLKNLSQSVAKYLLCRGARLVYGGDIRQNGFTGYLLEEARILNERLKDHTSRIIDYLAWPIYCADQTALTLWEADHIQLAEIIRVAPDAVGPEIDRTQYLPDDSPRNRYIRGKCLSKMRDAMLDGCDIRICAGGRKTDYKGCMPGILEETAQAVRKGKPLYLLGGFGGVTQSICRLLEYGDVDECLRAEWQAAQNLQYAELLAEYRAHGETVDYEQAVIDLRDADLKNGLTDEENRLLFHTCYESEAIRLILKGLERLYHEKK